jgi:hypothetical protein
MSHTSEFVLRAFSIGVGATIVMDLWALLLKQLGIPSLNFAFLCRWIGHLPHGQWIHEGIAKAAPIRGELWLGWFAHYSIGVTFAALLLGVYGLEWARKPTLLPALIKTPKPIFNCIKSLTTHTVFGLGLYLAALATASLLPAALLATQSKAAVTVSSQVFSQGSTISMFIKQITQGVRMDVIIRF